MTDVTSSDAQPRLVVLNRDLFFGVRLAQIGRELGYAMTLVKTSPEFLDGIGGADVALGIIDISSEPDWETIATGIANLEGDLAPVLAFGAHVDVDGLRSAKLAGVVRVISNGDFHRDPVKVIQRYARNAAPVPND